MPMIVQKSCRKSMADFFRAHAFLAAWSLAWWRRARWGQWRDGGRAL